MAPTTLHSTLHRVRSVQVGLSLRSLSTTTPKSASTSILFALSALSNSRETQHFNKITKLSRIEHSPPLQLIKSGEVDTYPLPDVPKRQQVFRSYATEPGRRRAATAFYNDRALKLGRAILSDHARQTHRLERALESAHRRSLKLEATVDKERQEWREQNRKMGNEMRIAGAWIVTSMGVATGLAMWRFWPENGSGAVDVGEKIRKKMERAYDVPAALSITKTAEAAAPRMTATQTVPVVESAIGGVAPPVITKSPNTSATQEKSLLDSLATSATPNSSKTESSWWKSLFWKQS